MHDTDSEGAGSDVRGTIASVLSQLDTGSEDECDSDGYVPSESEAYDRGADVKETPVETLLGSLLRPPAAKPPAFEVVRAAPASKSTPVVKVAPKPTPVVKAYPHLTLAGIGKPVVAGPVNISKLVGIPKPPPKPIFDPAPPAAEPSGKLLPIVELPPVEEPARHPGLAESPFPGKLGEVHGHARAFAHERPVLFLLALGVALYFIFFKQDSLFETVLHTGTKTRRHDKVETVTEEVHTKREAVIGKPVFPGKKTAD